MKKKTCLGIVLLCVFSFMIHGQATEVIAPLQRSNVTVIAPLKIQISDYCKWGGIHDLNITLSRSGQPVSGAKVTCGSTPLGEPQPGLYHGSIALPVALGQAIVITVVDPLRVTYTATATIRNTVRIVSPANLEVIDRAQVRAIPVKWVFASGSAPVYILINNNNGVGQGVHGYTYYSKKDVTGGQIVFPLGGVPAGTPGLWINVFLGWNEFTFSGPVAPGSRGAWIQYDSVHVLLK